MACSSSMKQPEAANLSEELTCAICYDLFRDPVMLGCMHHFCKECITTYWKSSRGPATCPQCRKEFTTKQFQTNYLVAGLVEKLRASSSPGSVRNLQKQIKDGLESQNSQKEELLAMIRKDKEQMNIIKKVGADLRKRVCGDFKALHHLLQVEETAMLEQLKRDQTEMEKTLACHLEALHTAVRELEETLASLQLAASTIGNTAPLPELSSRPRVPTIKALSIEGLKSKYIAPLQYTLWRKMFLNLKPGPLPLTFDEDTVHPGLQLSRDRTQVVETEALLPYKLNPKRFVQCVNVLAAQGFHTGRHYWEVAVGTKTKWDIGVALETVNRQARVRLCPNNGYWTLRLRNNTEYSAGTQPWTPLRVTSRPLRIGVFLDCEERRVSFYNADDMSLLCSFSNGPVGKAFPFFSTCLSEPGQRAQPIQLLHFPTMAVRKS
ncbi:tripartite motif containing 105 isoform X1 [Clarias gariepinus]|uniref:tripartite motif containing 105 isoform X1 n=1 Tax=Clarias gariepinus TaxID=13013 RepID=UPI00234CCA5A|nr:tripartite motif containing 105 isoform X1 [Clarias gariepinus]XP_053361462.1 tripartite motif containing 105 isoform X1 [Clarias gariepinus]